MSSQNVNSEPNSISDDDLKAAIVTCRPYQYLDDLKRRVAAHLDQPDLHLDHDFGYRVYCVNRAVEQEETQSRIHELGFIPSTPELLQEWEGQKVEMLVGLNSLFGERIEVGRIKPDRRGGHLFLPKGNRTRGYLPTFIRKAA